ncbi:hypothetical protein [Desulfovirgula thermocuniculi]|uniref:hypothetical protein n=1 Tax=Desulfovirgula thermocuniculi TaxID=348842 RepID=UPI0012EB237D|nr:hypothetical protein [Desulfovirgula thermocuniculi]
MKRRERNLEQAARLVGGTVLALLAKNAGLRVLGAGVALSGLLRGGLKGLGGLRRWKRRRRLL